MKPDKVLCCRNGFDLFLGFERAQNTIAAYHWPRNWPTKMFWLHNSCIVYELKTTDCAQSLLRCGKQNNSHFNTHESTVGFHTPRANITAAIHNASNRYNVICSDTCQACGITHDTTFPILLQTKIKEKELCLRECLINTLWQSHFKCSSEQNL